MATLAKFIVALILTLLMTSCAFDINLNNGVKGNGTVITESRNIGSDFTEVIAQEGLDVYVTQGKKFKISVEADENVIDLIRTDIHGDKLRIHTENNIGRATKKIYVTLPEITALKSSSGADLYTTAQIKVESIELSASSGSDIHANIVAKEIDAESSSGADIRITGTTETFIADASSGSDIRAKELEAKECLANASSGADIYVNVSDRLTAKASSGGDVQYSGNPTVHKNKSVSGSVHKG